MQLAVSRFLTAHTIPYDHRRVQVTVTSKLLYSDIHVGSRWKIQDRRQIHKLNTIQRKDTTQNTAEHWFSRLLRHSARKRGGLPTYAAEPTRADTRGPPLFPHDTTLLLWVYCWCHCQCERVQPCLILSKPLPDWLETRVADMAVELDLRVKVTSHCTRRFVC